MLKRCALLTMIALALALGIGSLTHATQVFETPPGAKLNGLDVAARAAFTIGYDTDMITILLENLIVNPTSVIQNVSDLRFSLSGPDLQQIGGQIPFSSSANFLNVWWDGNYVGAGSGSTGWTLTSNVIDPYLNLYLKWGPNAQQTIIGAPGPGGYTNANSSITGTYKVGNPGNTNNPHNPFIDQSATFTLDFSQIGFDLLPDITVQSVQFSFGTEGTPLNAVPEPGTLLLLASGLLGFVGYGRKKFFKA